MGDEISALKDFDKSAILIMMITYFYIEVCFYEFDLIIMASTHYGIYFVVYKFVDRILKRTH